MSIRHALGVALVCILVLWIFGGLGVLSLREPIMVLLHSILELSSIIPYSIVFYVIWYGSTQAIGPRLTMLGLSALTAVFLQTAHLFTYPGSPVNWDGTASSMWVLYSLLGRLLLELGLLYAVWLPMNGPNTLPSRTLLYTIIGLCAGLIVNVALNHEIWFSEFPLLDRYSYYLGLTINLATLLSLRCSSHRHTANNLLQITILFSVLADCSFILYMKDTQTINLSAHLFQMASAWFLVAFSQRAAIRQPYQEVMQYKDELEALAANTAKQYQESEQQRNLIEDTLAKIGVMISSQLNLKDTMESIADMVADLIGARQSIIALVHKDQSSLQVGASYGISTPPTFIPLSNSLAGQVLEKKTALSISDLTVHPEIYRPQLIFSSIRSVISAPLVNDQEVIGVLEAYSSEKGAFDDADRMLLKALGYHAGAAVASAMLYEETKVRLDEEKFLYQIAHSAASTIDLDTIISQCTGHVVQALHADIGLGLLPGAQRGIAEIKACINLTFPESSIELAAFPKLSSLLDTLKPAAAPCEVFPLVHDHCEGSPVRQLLVMPLSVERRLLGFIIIGWQRYVSQEHLNRPSFPALMAQQIALGLEKAQLYNQVKAMALSDGLTGLANRRNFDMFLRTELRRAASLSRPLSLIMFDLDKFKTYNDTYGHLIGDKLLSQIGEILRHGVRSIDFPARYGGEEFSVILPECSNGEAMAIAEKLRQTVEESQFPDNMSTHTAQITASLGVATYEPSLLATPPDMETLISLADKALYQAKQQGRNRVVSTNAIQ